MSKITKKRVTIVIDEDLDRKLRIIQSKQIQQTSSSVSFSSVLNEKIRKGLRNF